MISVFVICFNEEKSIDRAIQSVLPLADELIVVDSGSTDQTLEILSKYRNVRVIHRNWTGFKDQKNFALILCSHPWVFAIDADEAASPELVTRIKKIVEVANNPVTCYRVRREEYFLGKHLKGGPGNPSFQERLFRKDAVEYVGTVHEYPVLKYGQYGLIQEVIHHNPEHGIERFLDKMNHYTSLEAKDRILAGKKSSLAHAFLTFLSTFLKNFFSYKGYKNGKEGLVLCFLEAFSRSVRHFKVWAGHKK
jgi:glycosyltransferase involved in cell wall biosynthesis